MIGDDHHHQDENAKQRGELSDQRRKRAAARRPQPGAQAAPRKFRADGVAAGDRHHDMQHGRQHGAQQKLGVVQRRIGEDIFLDDQRPRRECGASGGEVGGRLAVAAEIAPDSALAALLPGVKNCLL